MGTCLLAAFVLGCGTQPADVTNDTLALDSVDLNDVDLDGVDATQDVLGQLDATGDTVGQDIGTDAVDAASGCTSTADCDDKNGCTTDTCKANGSCSHANADVQCDDGNACTSDDACVAGACSGTTVVCADNNVCTTDACEPKTGCVHLSNEATCTDDNPCTTGDVCNGGACTTTPVACADENACTTDLCDGETGACVHNANNLSCDDGNKCTTDDYCANKVCTHDGNLSCNDQNDCTADSCEPTIGCVNGKVSDASCSDGNACTIGDWCADGACLAGEPTSCNDENLCTDDSCNPDNGACVNLANAVTCDDGDPCTLGDACTDTTCQGNPNTCGQGNFDPNVMDSCLVSYCDYADGLCKPNNGNDLVWQNTFASVSGWKLQGEWQIGLPVASTDQTFGDPDPYDTNSLSGIIAGTAIGGNISNTPHDWYYLTSPAIDLSMYATSTFLDYSGFNQSMYIDFQWYANLSGAAGQYMSLEFSGDGKTWVSALTSKDDLIASYWSAGYDFINGMYPVIPKDMLTQRFRFRFGYKVSSIDAVVPIVSGLSVANPRIFIGNCWD